MNKNKIHDTKRRAAAQRGYALEQTDTPLRSKMFIPAFKPCLVPASDGFSELRQCFTLNQSAGHGRTLRAAGQPQPRWTLKGMIKMQNRISELIFRGNKLLAIKELRDSEGIDLRSAKEKVERLEAELKAQFPDRFGLPGTPEDQQQVERIITEEDFLRALSSEPSGWSLSSFEKIPMGWSAKLTKEKKELTIWSHRFDIEASISPYGDAERDRSLLHRFPETLSDFQQVHHILDAALKEE